MGTNNYRYILVDKNGAELEIIPSELNADSEINPDCPRFSKHLTMDENVHFFNALFDTNRELMENLIYLYNENHMSLKPDDYVCVKLISKELTNSYGLPIYRSCREENKGNLLMPIIYKSDLDIVDHRAKAKKNENCFYEFDLHSPHPYTFFNRIPSTAFISSHEFYKGEFDYLLACFKKKLRSIYAIEQKKNRKVIVQEVDRENIQYQVSNILLNTTAVKINENTGEKEEEHDIFSKYVLPGDFFYRLMLDIMIVSKRVFLVNNGKCSFNELLPSQLMTERYFTYSKEELKKLNIKDQLYKEEQEILTNVFEDVKASMINNKSDEENLRDFINRINSNFDGTRPSYVPKETEEDLLPFRYEEVEEDKTPEEYYTLDDYYYNDEIRSVIDQSENDEHVYSDLDERHDRSR